MSTGPSSTLRPDRVRTIRRAAIEPRRVDRGVFRLTSISSKNTFWAVVLLASTMTGCQTADSVSPLPTTGPEATPRPAMTTARQAATPAPAADTALNDRRHRASGVTIASVPAPEREPDSHPDRPLARVTMPDVRDTPIYDRSSPAYALLQQADTALAGFPLDTEGNVDWIRALRSGHINPRVSISGQGQMQVDPREIVMRDTREMAAVVFPHQTHTEWLACENCHDGIFVAKQGANAITMDDIFRGRYCGVCHDKVAFSSYVCDRCHSAPAGAAKTE